MRAPHPGAGTAGPFVLRPRHFAAAGIASALILSAYVMFLQNTYYSSLGTPEPMLDAGFKARCGEHFLQRVTNCRITDTESGWETIPNETIPGGPGPGEFDCRYETADGRMLPCIIDSLGKTERIRQG